MQKKEKNYINNSWVEGSGKEFISKNPLNEEIVWQGKMTTASEISKAVEAAKQAFPSWADLPLETRIEYLTRYQNCLTERRTVLAETLSIEIGKPLWEANTEVGAMIHKIPLSIAAYNERCKTTSEDTASGKTKLHHKPHGVVAVFGAFNFPGHLPNGHIVPALLAGNTIVFKPSEYAPLMAEKMIECWETVNLPKGVLNLVQGGGDTGQALSKHPDIKGVFFTGSYNVGRQLSETFAATPEKILALEMGGNNPLVVHDIKENQIDAAVYHTIQSAYITAGQRCTCARRLIVTKNTNHKEFINRLIQATQKLKVGAYWEKPEPFLGPVISKEAALHIKQKYDDLIEKGGTVLVPLEMNPKYPSLLTPGFVDVTAIENRIDEEIFGPLLQLIFVDNFEDALKEANNTAYGLAAGIFCTEQKDYERFYKTIRAGIINWNRPTTGSSGSLPFGGLGKSGNHRPAGFYAADYCAYPVGSMEVEELHLPDSLLPGITL